MASVRLSGEKARFSHTSPPVLDITPPSFGALGSISLKRLPAGSPHRLTNSSLKDLCLPTASTFPSGLREMCALRENPSTLSTLTGRSGCCCPLSTSHSLIVPTPVAAKSVPEGRNDKAEIFSRGQPNSRRAVPERVSHRP